MGSAHTELVRVCLEELAIQELFAWKNNSFGVKVKDRVLRAGQPGSADILSLLAPWGTSFCVECKVPPDTQQHNQKIFQMRIEQSGGIYVVVHSRAQLIEAIPAARALAEKKLRAAFGI